MRSSPTESRWVRQGTALTAMVIVLLAAVNAEGQAAPSGERLAVGAKAGINYATIPAYDEAVGQDVENAEPRIGVLVGAFARIALARRLALQPEVLFATKGTKYDPTGPHPQFTVKLAYLEIPVLVRVAVPYRGKAAPYLFGGSGLAVRLSDDLDPTPAERFLLEPKRIEAIYVVGAGVGLGRLFVEGRFHEGLTSIAKNTDVFTESLTTRTISFVLGMVFEGRR